MILIVHMRPPAISPIIGMEICWFETDREDPSRIDVLRAPDRTTITFSAELSNAWAWGVSHDGEEAGPLASWMAEDWREQYSGEGVI